MVIRIKKRSRKYLGSRSWGAGNIKNARGSGDRGGVGRAGKKHKFTRIVKYEKGRIKKHGFTPWRQVRLEEINLDGISRMAHASKEDKPTIELKGYKVLGGSELAKPCVVKAAGFSKKAMEKIKAAGGEAITI
ncbi:MAG: uL15 family ribosomal protein [Candidatus Micrarchaeota archaeon]|nr:uL15 family ribosomal protein [Candidatus Micrarchaeota archaeon]